MSVHCDAMNDAMTCAFVGDPSGAESLLSLIDPILRSHFLTASLLKIRFTDKENRIKFSSCVAVHGREPLLAVCNCAEDRCYALDLEGSGENSIRAFLDRIAANTERPAKTGAMPLPDDAFDASIDLDLGRIKCAVQSTYRRLVGRQASRHEQEHRCLAVLFSDSCPCCPPLLRVMDHLFALADARLGSHSTPSRAVRRNIVACNVDENELDAEDWPEEPELQVVPLLNGYIDGHLTRFRGPKTGEKLIHFTSEILCGPHDAAVQAMAQYLAGMVAVDTQGRIQVPRAIVASGLAKSKRTRSGRELQLSELESGGEGQSSEVGRTGDSSSGL
jgi:hypothetical protein